MKFTSLSIVIIFAAMLTSGCATTSSSNTSRTASEQLLISSAIDRAFSNVEFSDFAGHKVFIDDAYLNSVDKEYLLGTLRHRILQGGGAIVGSADASDLVLEPRSGGVGTDKQESFIGVPSIGIPGLPIELPEIKLVSKATQMGTAKIGLVCYDPKTGQSLGSGGASTALTHSSDTYVMGVGPFRSGAVVDERKRAVGYTGVGGSLSGGGRVARSAPVNLIDGPAMMEKDLGLPMSTAVEQIATLPGASGQ